MTPGIQPNHKKNQAFNIPHMNSPTLYLKTRIKNYAWDYPKTSQPLFSWKARNQEH